MQLDRTTHSHSAAQCPYARRRAAQSERSAEHASSEHPPPRGRRALSRSVPGGDNDAPKFQTPLDKIR
eukprot:scaffold130576_cov48-Phaeocystis_antarctica.AAC.2